MYMGITGYLLSVLWHHWIGIQSVEIHSSNTKVSFWQWRSNMCPNPPYPSHAEFEDLQKFNELFGGVNGDGGSVCIRVELVSGDFASRPPQGCAPGPRWGLHSTDSLCIPLPPNPGFWDSTSV